ncbi:hypothetical protein V6Z12_D11G392400 [Gossypium hirsutum]
MVWRTVKMLSRRCCIQNPSNKLAWLSTTTHQIWA